MRRSSTRGKSARIKYSCVLLAIAVASLAATGRPAALPPSSAASADSDLEIEHDIAAQLALQRKLLAQIKREAASMPDGARRQRLSHDIAAIEKLIADENARPHRRYIASATKDDVFGAYRDEAARRIEDWGTKNFPQVDGRAVYGRVILNATIASNGHLIDTQVVESSGDPALDKKAVSIALAVSPFGPFTPAMRKAADEIVVTWPFNFVAGAPISAAASGAH